jgi:hypothetical protein
VQLKSFKILVYNQFNLSMNNTSCRPTKRAKLSNPLPKRTPAELINAIPPPDYEPLSHRQIYRPPRVQLPPNANTDPCGLLTLFLTESHFETIAANTNQYAEAKKAGSEGKRTLWPTNAVEIKTFVGVFIYIGVVRLPAYEDCEKWLPFVKNY